MTIPIQQLVDEYLAGASGPDLARKYGCTRSNIYQRLYAVGVTPRHENRGGGQRKIELPIEEIINLYGNGEGCPSIASRYGVSTGTIETRLHDAGISTRRYPRIPDEQLLADYATGMNVMQVAEKYGLAYSGVHRRLARAGVIRGHGYKIRRKQ